MAFPSYLSRWGSLASLLGAIAATTRPATAESRLARPNHGALIAAPFTYGAYDATFTEGGFSEKNVTGWLARLEYRRALTEVVDLGVGIAYHQAKSTQLIIPAAVVRFAIAPSETLELGASARLGAGFARVETPSLEARFSGIGLGVGLDSRFRVSANVGLMVEAQILAGLAEPSSASGPSAAAFTDKTSLLWIAVAPAVGVDLAF